MNVLSLFSGAGGLDLGLEAAAAWAAAGDALKPTTTQLQADAHQLVDRMLAVTGN